MFIALHTADHQAYFVS